MYELDLTREVVANGYRRNESGQQEPVVVKTPLSTFVKQSLARVGSFERAEKVRDLISKAESGQKFIAEEDEMKIIFEIFQRTETKTMLVFADMVEELNSDVDVVSYEKKLKVTAA